MQEVGEIELADTLEVDDGGAVRTGDLERRLGAGTKARVVAAWPRTFTN
jgi:hypothetical protein